MIHSVVVNLKNRPMLRGYYRTSDSAILPTSLPGDLPTTMEIEPEDGSSPVLIELKDAKAVFFVRNFTGSPTKQDVRFFDSLSIHPYLWARVTFQDGEVMEGRVANSIELLTQNAFRLFPVDELTNNRCLFVPKESVNDFQIIGLLEEQVLQLEVA